MALIPQLRPDRGRSGRPETAPENENEPGPRWRLSAGHRQVARGPAHTEETVTPSTCLSPPTLDALLDEFTDRWDRGETPRAEEFLARLGPDCAPADVVALVYHEYCLAESSDQQPDPADYLRRFPAQRERLSRLFGLHGVLGSAHLRHWTGIQPAPVAMPEAGDAIGPYRLLRELGRGAFARVFLAEQADLADRLVVVKVSTHATPEPHLLARAQHAHIVEVLRYAEADDGAFQLLCMPFQGGASLAAVLAERQRQGGQARWGSELLTDLDQVAAPEYPDSGRGGPAREILAPLSRARAVAWMIARLAEALDHAHARGVSHGDLKPANILLTADARPMLLDFNLALDWRAAEGPDGLPAVTGGTLAYMAPERLRAVADPGNASRPRPIDRHRADLYALGLILVEMLGGRLPEMPDAARGLNPRIVAESLLVARTGHVGRRFLRAVLRGVPPEMRPIVTRCLAPDPADRYARAADLAEDLDRYRADLPARHAGPLPRLYRLARLAQRHRLAVAAGVLVLLGSVPAGVIGMQARQDARLDAALARLETLWNGRTPGVYGGRYAKQLQDGSSFDQTAAYLGQLKLYGVNDPGDWRRRDDVRLLPEPVRLDLEGWLMERAWRYSEAVATRPPEEFRDDWRRALFLLKRVAGPNPPTVLRDQMKRLAATLGEPAPPVPAGTAPRWIEDYLLGVAIENSQPEKALKHYKAALEVRPDAFWVNYRASVAAAKQTPPLYEEAINYIERCQDARPRNARLYFGLAGYLYYLNKPDEGLRKCSQAMALDPELHEAYQTRMYLWDMAVRTPGFDIARKPGGPGPVESNFRKFQALYRDRDAADSWRILLDAEAAFGPEVAYAPGPDGDPLDHLRAAAFSDPDARWALAWRLHERGEGPEALSQLGPVIAYAPDRLEPRLARANLLYSQRLERRALEELIADPRFEDLARRYSLALRAFHRIVEDDIRQGDHPAALRQARRALDLATRLQVLRGESHYALARALAASAREKPELIPEAAHQLREAARFSPIFTEGWFEKDFAFDGLRDQIRPLIGPNPAPPET